MIKYIFLTFELVLGIGLLFHSFWDVSHNQLFSSLAAWGIACGLFIDAIRRAESIVARKSVQELRQSSVRVIKINQGMKHEECN